MLLDTFNDDEILSPYLNDKINEKLPDQLQDFFETSEIDPEFKVTVQAFTNENYAGRPKIIGEFIGEVPNYERLVKTNGACFYRYKILYKKDGLSKKQNVDVDLTAKNWGILAKEGDRERSEIRRNQIKEEMEDKNALIAYGGINSNQPNPREYMKDTIDMFTQLTAATGAGNQNNDGFGVKEMMLMMLQMQQQSTNQMMQMFGMMSKQQGDMTTALLGNKNGESDKLFEMAERMINIKNIVSPREEGLIEKIGNFIGKNIDVIGELLAKPPAARQEDTLYKKTENSWQMKKIKEKMETNKAFAEKLISHLDSRVGAETTDQILEGFIKYNRQTPIEGDSKPVNNDEITEEDFED